jgi:hypothetical protein
MRTISLPFQAEKWEMRSRWSALESAEAIMDDLRLPLRAATSGWSA